MPYNSVRALQLLREARHVHWYIVPPGLILRRVRARAAFSVANCSTRLRASLNEASDATLQLNPARDTSGRSIATDSFQRTDPAC